MMKLRHELLNRPHHRSTLSLKKTSLRLPYLNEDKNVNIIRREKRILKVLFNAKNRI